MALIKQVVYYTPHLAVLLYLSVIVGAVLDSLEKGVPEQ